MKKKASTMMLAILMSTISTTLVSANGHESITNYSGKDRYETSVNISKKSLSKADKVIIASGENFADALSASALSIQEKAPILLTRRNELPKIVREEIKRLRPDTVIIFGGPNAVDESIKKDMEKEYKVERICGNNRYETSIKAYEYKKRLNPLSTKIGLASGVNFADALVAAPFISKDGSIILTNGKSNSDVKPDFVFGGQNTIPGYKGIKRFAGKDRYETALKIADEFNSKKAILSNGVDYPDALSASILSAINNSPILLTNKKLVSPSVKKFITDKNYDEIMTVGGKKSVPSELKEILFSKLENEVSNKEKSISSLKNKRKSKDKSESSKNSEEKNDAFQKDETIKNPSDSKLENDKDKKVEFANNSLRIAINQILGDKKKLINPDLAKEDIDVKTYEPTVHDMENIKQIVIRSLKESSQPGEEKSLKGIEVAKNAELLHISGTKLDNVNAILELTNLKTLRLNNNKLENIPNLERLKNLNEVSIMENSLESLSFLKYNTQLKKINSMENNIKSIEDLKNLKNLEEVELSFNYLRNLKGIEGHGKLKKLSATNNKLTNLKDLKDLPNLDVLDLTYNDLTSLEGIERCKSLRYLMLVGHDYFEKIDRNTPEGEAELKKIHYESIEPLRGLTNLEALSIKENLVKDITPLSDMKKLKYLHIYCNKVEDITPLAGLTELRELNISRNEVKKIDAVKNMKKLRVFFAYHNRISDPTPAFEIPELGSFNLCENNLFDISMFHKDDITKQYALSTDRSTGKMVADAISKEEKDDSVIIKIKNKFIGINGQKMAIDTSKNEPLTVEKNGKKEILYPTDFEHIDGPYERKAVAVWNRDKESLDKLGISIKTEGDKNDIISIRMPKKYYKDHKENLVVNIPFIDRNHFKYIYTEDDFPPISDGILEGKYEDIPLEKSVNEYTQYMEQPHSGTATTTINMSDIQ